MYLLFVFKNHKWHEIKRKVYPSCEWRQDNLLAYSWLQTRGPWAVLMIDRRAVVLLLT